MSNVISDVQLARMRSAVLARLPDVAVIQQVARVSDDAGGWTETWTAVSGGTVACRLDPVRSAGGRDGLVAGREALVVAYQMTMPHNAPIAQDRRVVVSGTTYEVVALDNAHSWRVSARAIVTVAK